MNGWSLLALALLAVPPRAPAQEPVPGTPAPPERCPLATAHLHARLSGALNEELDWSPPALECDGMQRADGGFRLRFTGPASTGQLVLVLGVPSLGEGASGKAVPVNVTLIPQGGHVYGTRGTDRCSLDEVRQSPVAPVGSDRRWQVEARGFCLEPARAVGGDDAILMTTFELTGLLIWEADTRDAH